MARTEKSRPAQADDTVEKHVVVIDADEFEEARRDPRLRDLVERADKLATRVPRVPDDR